MNILDSALSFPAAALERADRRGPRKHIGVIGAGIAGLTAAYELERAGHSVTIFESTARIGGRIRTHTFADGTSGELGAMRIPSNHHCTLHYVDEFDLPTRPFINHNPQAYYLLRNRKHRIADWKRSAARYRLKPGEVLEPARLLDDLMASAIGELNTAERRSVLSGGSSPRAVEYDAVSLRQFVTGQGLSNEAFEYVGHATGMLQYERASFLECLIDYFGLLRVDQIEIVGGMERLVQALSARLQARIYLNTAVTGIKVLPNSVSLSTNVIWPEARRTFDYIVCTAPAAPTARIHFEPGLSPLKLQAFRGLYYASAAKTLLHTTSRPWEFVDGIHGGGSFSDQLFQQCWYPSDNARQTDSNQWAGASSLVSHGPGVLTASYTWENNARRMAAMSPDDRTDEVLRALELLHPGLSDTVDDVVHIVWDQEPSPGSGGFAYFAPGEYTRYHRALCRPHPTSRPRVFFAGEHTSLLHAWIQGAIESALSSTIAILSAPSGLRDVTDPVPDLGVAT